MKKNLLVFLICNAFISTLFAQPKLGTPAIKNYTTADYNAGSGIWDIKQDRNGILYFANNDGLVTFDGSYWKTYVLPNKSAIKSLAIDPSGKIYVGGQDEIGYFFPNEFGTLKFHSLKHLMPQSARQFADIWDIVFYKNEVFFRTIECIFELKDNKIYTFDAPGGWIDLNAVGSQLFASDKDAGFSIFKDSKWQPYNPGQKAGQLKTSTLKITGITPFGKNSLLITSRKHGLFLMTPTVFKKMTTAADGIFNTDLINATVKIAENRFAICTTSNGLLIINAQGKLLEQFSNKHGLQNNNINSILLDNNKNLWLGLENGIDFINYNTSIKHIYPSRENHVKGNAVAIFDNRLYIGTSSSLYSAPINNQQKDISTGTGLFTEVKNTKGSVLSLANINNHLLMGHTDGVMSVAGNEAKLITNGPGAAMVMGLTPSTDVIAGTYTGFQLLKYINGGFVNNGRINGIYESLGNLARDNQDNIWATHPHRGIFKAKLSADRKNISTFNVYTQKDGLPSILNNHVYFIKKKLIAATESGVYEYDIKQNKFKPSAFFKPIFGNNSVEHLTEDSEGNLWFVSNQHVGVVDFNTTKGQFKMIYFPELTGQTVKGDAHIFPFDMENIFIGSNDGVFHLNYNQYVSSESKLNVLLTSVKAIGEKDSVIFGGYFMNNNQISATQDLKNIASLSKNLNSFHFEYSSTLFAQKGNEEFSYKLIGFDNDWSKWSVKTEKDYTNLPAGKYTFSVKVRNNLGNASTPVNYTFVVEPAWYQTIWAFLFYVLILAYGVYYIVKEQRKRFQIHQQKHEEEQKRLSYLHGLELDRNEKEIVTLKNNNLETELNYKNKELATLTMHLVDRGKLLLNIKEELMTLIHKLNIPDPAYQFRSVFKLLSDTDKNEEDWDHFAIYFDQVYNNYLSTMKTKFPNLSSTDLKLCAYLRLNLSSKETAQLLNISLKGVEISRYRLRKKLQLAREVNLYDFLIEVTK
ncbi:two-component regulator propeller domain-containing protein [Pedobacter sp. UC225_61]|uniref:ligand-binding sensor domain-containing protein n=1 Tax=Pedobacter sp. UC225_61 TaxID=3374623 RepID=UPI00378C8235